MNLNKDLWEKGDFTRIASTMRKSGEELVASIGVTTGMKVLDLGCGDGNTAIPFARLGATVTGVDIASNLIAAGKKRAEQENLTNITFIEGDACNLDALSDGEFDLTISMFGAMFAPKPFDVAKEMVRVTRPGGKIIMGNWIPGDPTLVAQTLRISAAYTPPPPEGFISPMLWGVEEKVIERFSSAGIPPENISISREPWTFTAPYAATKYVEVFRTFYGPNMNAFEAAEKNGKASQLQQELEDLFNCQNKSTVPDETLITVTYLKVTVLR